MPNQILCPVCGKPKCDRRNHGGEICTNCLGIIGVNCLCDPSRKVQAITDKDLEEFRNQSSLPEDDAQRALYPMADGCLDYFPNALAEVSRISRAGSEKYNPGEPMYWARGKSTDHRNRIIRHTVDSLPDTEEAIEHAAQAAWRSLAHLQEKIEKVRGVPMSRGSKAPVKEVFDRPINMSDEDADFLLTGDQWPDYLREKMTLDRPLYFYGDMSSEGGKFPGSQEN